MSDFEETFGSSEAGSCGMVGYSVEGGSKIDHQQLSYGVGKSNIHAGSGRKGAAD